MTRVPPSVEFGARASDAKRSAAKAAVAALPVRPKSAIDTVDVLVVHTPGALAHSSIGGNVEDLNSRIAQSFVQVESALATSGMDTVRVRNVLTGSDLSIEIPYNEVPGNTCDEGTFAPLCRWVGHRIWLRTSTEVAALRNIHGADLVVMLVGDQFYGGIAYVQNIDCGVFSGYESTLGCDVGAAYSPFAFSVVSVPFATSFQVFAHETGHQFGMQHQAAAFITPAYPWSYAKTRSDGLTQTIIGDSQINRSLQYSNPNVPFIGTSEPSGEALRFNARTGVCLAPAMSGFRAPEQLLRVFADGFEEQLVPLVGC